MSCFADTRSVDLEVTAGVLTADVILNPDPANGLTYGLNGLYVSGENNTGWFFSGLTWTFSAATDPVYQATTPDDVTGGAIAPGMRILLYQGGVPLYFILTDMSYSAATQLTTFTLYGGTDYDLANAVIESAFFSGAKAPRGFPLAPTKWTQEATYALNYQVVNPTSGTWYNMDGFALTLPTGIWSVDYRGMIYLARQGGQTGKVEIEMTLSTSNNSVSDPSLTYYLAAGVEPPDCRILGEGIGDKVISVASPTTYYWLQRQSLGSIGTGNIQLVGAEWSQPAYIRAICAYL